MKRAKAIILKPAETWQTIKQESQTIQELMINYAAPLALIPAVATLIGISIVGIRIPAGHIARAPFMEALAGSVVGYVIQLISLLAVAWAINVLAPYFNARSDFSAAFKVAVYSMTPAWLLGIFSALPGLSVLQIFGLYGYYLLYLGIKQIMESPAEKTLWYTTLAIIASIFISLVLSIFVGGAVYGPMFMRMMAL
mgnify:CR=1 FL=1